jgi:hypothetical protein
MAHEYRDEKIRGKIIRLTWTDGPTKGESHEHNFSEAGTVTWRAVDDSQKRPAAEAKAPSAELPSTSAERSEYAAIKVADDAYIVSYLASSGYTLTVVLNYRDHSVVGFASGAKEWFPVKGTFQVVK